MSMRPPVLGELGLPPDRIKADPSGCLLWTGVCTRTGYGFFGVWIYRDGQRVRTTRRVHRIAYEAVKGPIPEGLVLDHLCRVHNCLNPDHLEAVTQQENIMRGEGLAAKNAAKTHCVHGHPFDAVNTYVTYIRGNKPKRSCRTCRLATQRRLRWAAIESRKASA